VPADNDLKAQVQQRFGQYAQGYVESKSHAEGADLERLVELAQPQSDWWALDVATGGGHTGLKFAPLVARVVASDLTPKMLEAARNFIAKQGVHNVDFSGSDAENLPFADNVFDLVTCRIAPHHFVDCFKFVRECARVLKPGGILLVEDQLVPEDDRAARYVDSFERLRDPSHNRIYAMYEWRGMFLDAGLTVEHAEQITKSGTELVSWSERQGCTPDVIERLQIMLAQAPDAVAAWMRPQYAGTPDAKFDHNYIIILGRKESKIGDFR
jgi:ubiquinone/menaquinone biosynthesis C-methylase UbiE